MPSVCFYFQLHQPQRVKEYSFFDIGKEHQYFNDELDLYILNKVADNCYIPAIQKLREVIKKTKKNFRFGISVTGILLDQLEKHRPDVIQALRSLARTGCVEFMGETYYHSLSSLYSKEEFARQVEMHRKKVKKLFKQSPQVFRNTELIHNNAIANQITKLGFKAVLVEGVDWLLNGRSPNYVYVTPNRKLKCLLRNYKFSDDIAFRFSNGSWSEYPLTADKYARWLHELHNSADVINIFLDFETFGEHQVNETGIFEFLEHMPQEILKYNDFIFSTPSEVVSECSVKGKYDIQHSVSWADTERDISAWLSNSMQSEALTKLYALEEDILNSGNKQLIKDWSQLQVSDLFYYMCTKYWADGEVHKYFSPYNSPYDSYIFFINILSDLEIRTKEATKKKKAGVT